MEKMDAVPAIAGGKPVRDTKIFYGHQYLDEADYQAVLDVLKSDYLTCGSGNWRKSCAVSQERSMLFPSATERRPCMWPVLRRVWGLGMR